MLGFVFRSIVARTYAAVASRQSLFARLSMLEVLLAVAVASDSTTVISRAGELLS